MKVTGGDDFLSACNITPLQLTDAISGSLQPLASLQLMQLDTFALANLVFPSGHKVRLTSAKLPQDLILQGTMVVPLTVQPDRVSLTPGATEQFSIAGGESVSWAVQPASRGTISNTGLYTAPATPSQTEVVSINAVSTKDLNRVGRAMAVIAPARPKTGISISPNSLRVAAGKTVAFTVTNDAGTPLEASVDLDPVGLGTLLEGFGTGQWTYSAPSQIAHSATVRIVAKSADKTGEAAFEVMPASVAIDITPKTASVAAGGSVRFTAKATGDLTWLAWPVGTVAADDAGAAYSAPSSVQEVQRVIVLAYSLDSNSTAGIAIAHVTVGSSS